MNIPYKSAPKVLFSAGILGIALFAMVASSTASSNKDVQFLTVSDTAAEQTNPENQTAAAIEGSSPGSVDGTPASNTSVPTATSSNSGTAAGNTSSTETTEPAATPTVVQPYVLDTSKQSTENGGTTTVTCYYSWSDGHQTSKVAGSYPTPAADGYNNVVFYPSCPEA